MFNFSIKFINIANLALIAGVSQGPPEISPLKTGENVRGGAFSAVRGDRSGRGEAKGDPERGAMAPEHLATAASPWLGHAGTHDDPRTKPDTSDNFIIVHHSSSIFWDPSF